MKQKFAALLVVLSTICVGVVAGTVVITTESACTQNLPPNLTPAAQLAFRQKQVQGVLDEIRDVVQAGNATTPPVFNTDTTRKVTLWHESAIKIVHDSGTGWKAAVQSGLDEVLKNLSPTEKATLSPYFSLAKTVLDQVN